MQLRAGWSWVLPQARRVAVAAFFACGAAGGGQPQAQETPEYRNAKLPVEQRVADLLSRMTLEEKVAQMEGAWENKNFHKDPQTMFVDEKGNFLPVRAALLMKDGLGQISRPSEGRGPREMAEYTNTVQKWMKENTRLGIP